MWARSFASPPTPTPRSMSWVSENLNASSPPAKRPQDAKPSSRSTMPQRDPARPSKTLALEALSALAQPPDVLRHHVRGVGADLVDITSFERNVAVGGNRWLANVFTELERNDTDEQTDRLATRFAAKEAVVKALGVGFRDGAG